MYRLLTVYKLFFGFWGSIVNMKEIQKNSLFNYFSKKKPSEGEPNTENRQGEISKLKNNIVAGKKENRSDQENGKGEKKQIIEPSSGIKLSDKEEKESLQSTSTKEDYVLQSSENLPQKTTAKRKQRAETDEMDKVVDEKETRKSKFKSLSKEVRAAIAIAQLMELSDDEDGAKDAKKRNKSEASRKPKKTKMPVAREEAKRIKTQKESSKSVEKSGGIGTIPDKNSKLGDLSVGKTKEDITTAEKSKTIFNNDTTESSHVETKGNTTEEDQSRKSHKKSSVGLARPASGARQKKDISNFFTRLK